MHPLLIASSGNKVFDISFPKTSLIIFWIIGVLTAQPTISIEWTSSNLTFASSSKDFTLCSHIFLNLSVTELIIFSNSSLDKLYTKSSPSIKESMLIVQSLFTVNVFLILAIVSNNLILILGDFIGLHPYFLLKSSDNFSAIK